MGRGIFIALKIFVLLVLCSPTVLSQETIQDGWIKTDITHTIDGINYTFQPVSNEDDFSRLIVRSADDKVLVQLGDCKIQKNITYCYESWAYKESFHIDASGDVQPGVFVKIKKPVNQQENAEAAFQVRILKNDSQEITSEHQGKLIINNTGNLDLFNFTGTLNIPNNLNLTVQKEGVLKVGNTLKIGRGFDSGEAEIIPFSYTYTKANESNMTFEYSYETTNSEGSGKKIEYFEPETSYVIDLTNPSSSKLYQSHPITISVQHSGNVPITVKNPTVSIDKNHQLKESSVFNFGPEKSWHVPSWRIDANSSQEHVLKLIPRYEGLTNITFTGRVKVGSFTIPFKRLDDFAVEQSKLNITFTPLTDVTVGKPIPFNVTISNPNDHMLYGIRVTGVSELGTIRFQKDNLTLDETYTFNTNISTKGVEPKNYPINFDTAYRTPTRELLRLEEYPTEFTVNKPPYGMYLFYEADKPEINETVDVALKLTNTGANPLENITVEHTEGEQDLTVSSDETVTVNTTTVTYEGSPVLFRAEASHPNVTESITYTVGGEQRGFGNESVKIVQPESEETDESQDESEATSEEESTEEESNPESDQEDTQPQQQSTEQDTEPKESALVTLFKSIDSFFAETFGNA